MKKKSSEEESKATYNYQTLKETISGFFTSTKEASTKEGVERQCVMALQDTLRRITQFEDSSSAAGYTLSKLNGAGDLVAKASLVALMGAFDEIIAIADIKLRSAVCSNLAYSLESLYRLECSDGNRQ